MTRCGATDRTSNRSAPVEFQTRDMGIYLLKICTEGDKPGLLQFIRKYWKEDHILAHSDALLRFQHYNPTTNEYNFRIAINTRTGDIDGIIGLIPVSQYDAGLAGHNDTWGGIWKVRDDVENEEIGSLGLRLFNTFNRFRSHGSIAMSAIAIRMHAMMKYTACTLRQYYILNPDCTNFRIAVIGSTRSLECRGIPPSDSVIKTIACIEDLGPDAVRPAYYPWKSLAYLANRFAKHPTYAYEFHGVYDRQSTIRAILVTRTIEFNGGKAIRIVDVFGSLDGVGSLRGEFERVLIEKGAEYVDLMNYGIPPVVFQSLGFSLLDVTGDTIIPNYFEPYVRENITIHCAFRAPSDYVIFKADSDQDRPSILHRTSLDVSIA